MAASRETVVRAITVIMGTVIALTFLFGFGTVLNLALRLGVSLYVTDRRKAVAVLSTARMLVIPL